LEIKAPPPQNKRY